MAEVCARNRGTRFYLEPSKLKRLKSEAALDGLSASEVVRRLVDDYLRSKQPARRRVRSGR